MARITWQNVDAPRLDTRDMAMAGEAITNAFGRLADTINQAQQRTQQREVDAQVVDLMRIQDPAELQKALSQVQDSPFARQILQQGQAQLGVLLDRDVKNEQLGALQDVWKNANAYSQIREFGQKNDIAGFRNFMEANGDLKLRDADRYFGEGLKTYDTGLDNIRMDAQLAEQVRSNKASEANAAASRDIQRAELALRQKQLALQQAPDAAWQTGRQLALANPNMSDADVAATIQQNSNQFKTPAEYQAALAGATVGLQQRGAITSAQLTGLTDSSNTLPGYKSPGTVIADANKTKQELLSGYQANLAALDQRKEFDGAPALADAASGQFKDVTVQSLAKQLSAQSGAMSGGSAAMERHIQQVLTNNGISVQQLAAGVARYGVDDPALGSFLGLSVDVDQLGGRLKRGKSNLVEYESQKAALDKASQTNIGKVDAIIQRVNASAQGGLGRSTEQYQEVQRLREDLKLQPPVKVEDRYKYGPSWLTGMPQR